MDFVLRTDARENAVDHAHSRRSGRHEAAHLREQHAQRHLAQEGALATHVRAGDDPDAVPALEAAIIGHKALSGGEVLLDDRVARIAQLQHCIGTDFWAHIVELGRCFGQRREYIQPRQCARATQQPARVRADLSTQLSESAALDCKHLLFGVEH